MTAQTFDADVLEMAPRLRAFLRRRVRDDATADDLTQETLLKAKLQACCRFEFDRLGQVIGWERRKLLCCEERCAN
jgi:hypothetical protein